MPFELGLACAIAKFSGPHDFFVFQKTDYGLDRSLSDLKGIDHSAHGGTVRGTINCVLDALHTTTVNPTPEVVFHLYQDIYQLAADLKRKYRRRSVFTRAMFGQLVDGGLLLAARHDLIEG